MTTDEWILVLHLHLRPFDIIPVQQQYQRSDKGMLIFSKKKYKKDSTDFEEKHQESKINICFNSWEAKIYLNYEIPTRSITSKHLPDGKIIIDLLNVTA